MKQMKCAISILLTVVMVIGLAVSASADWTQFRGGVDNNAVMGISTPKTASDVEQLWSTQLTSGSWMDTLGEPILVGDKLYAAMNNELYELDKQGNVLRTFALSDYIGYFAYISSGGGNIYVPLADGVIEAVDVSSWTSSWTSAPLANKQINGPVLCHNGYVYFGTVEVNASYTNIGGEFVCLNAADGSTVWTCNSATGFYGSGGAVVGDYIVFGDDDGVLYSYTLAGALVDQYTPANAGPVRSAVVHDGNRKLYFVSTNGYIHRVTLNTNGTFDTTSGIDTATTYMNNTTPPVIYGGKVYVVTGENFTDGAVELYTADLVRQAAANIGYSQSAPLLAYDAAGNAYVYVALNKAGGAVLCVSNLNGTSTVAATELLAAADYSMASFIADEQGVLYYADGGALKAIRLKPVVVPDTSDGDRVTVYGGSSTQTDSGKTNPNTGR